MSNFREPNKQPLGFADNYEIRTALFWNTWREATEAGCFTVIEGIIGNVGLRSIFASVGTGIAVAATVAICGWFGVGAGHRTVGITCTGITQILAVGLFTGFVAAFQEVAEIKSGDEPTWVFMLEGSGGRVLDAFGFAGLKHEMSVETVTALFLCHLLLSWMQYHHNYKGRSFKCWRYTNDPQDIKSFEKHIPECSSVEIAKT